MTASEEIKECVVVFSGGTDSMCVAALKAREFQKIHLLTFYDYGTKDEPFPMDNVLRLKKHYPQVEWVYRTISTDKIIRFFGYKNYLRDTLKHGLLNCITPAFSTMSWHTRTIAYCLEHNIENVFDGMTNEMVQLPGHMGSVIAKLKSFYSKFNINFDSPVREWAVPEDQDVLDRVIVDQHGFLFPSEQNERVKTTGEYLYQEGIFPHPNIKGSQFDRQMQHDCYPFVLYNILTYWYFLHFSTYDTFSDKVANFIDYKLNKMVESLTAIAKGDTAPIFEKEELHELI